MKALKDICEVNPKNSILPENFIYIDLESVSNGKLTTCKVMCREGAPSRAQRLLSFNDVIFQIVRPYQRNNFHLKSNNNLNYVASTGYAQLRAKNSPDFLFHAIHTDNFVDLVIKKCTGSSYPAINSSDLAEIPLAFPLLPEQQKIADCLSSLDELITATDKRLAAIQTHKKGLMQQLFPQAGASVPRLRFPEFAEAGDWEVKALKDICEVNPKNSILPENFIYIDLESVSNGKLTTCKVMCREGAPSRAQRLLSFNDVIFQIVRPYQRNNFHLKSNNNLNYVASTGYAQLRAKNSPDFLFHAIHTDNFVDLVIKKCTGSSYPAINSSDLAEIPLAFPLLPEQQKIADCLSSLDELITATDKRLAALQTQKKGLMQAMFPAPATPSQPPP